MSPLAVAVSPHLDDAVFSAGATLAALAADGYRVRVLTCFTATVTDPGAFALACQTDKGIGPDVDYMALRRTEDCAAVATLGAEPVHLPLAEAPHRGYGSPAALFDGARSRDPARADLRELLPAHLADADLVLAPQAIGDHVDHRLVTEAVAVLRPDALWWRDTPYVVRRPGAPAWYVVPDGRDVARPIGRHLDVKIAAAARYASQLGFQFGGADRLGPALRRLAAAEGRRAASSRPSELFRGIGSPAGG